MPRDQIHAGYGRTDITPSLAVPHAGWGAQTHLLADGVHRPLYVSVLLLEQSHDEGRERIALVEFDLVGLHGLERGVQEAVAAEAALDPDQVRVTVTHNHANPVMWDNWIGDGRERVREYRDGLATAAAGAARAARLGLQPVRAASGTGRCTIGRNRRQTVEEPDGSRRVIVGRDDAGPTDPEVAVLRLDRLDGTPFAAVFGYTCHPTTLGPDNRLHSPDYPGVAKAVVEAATGAPVLFMQGAAGDVGPRHGFVDDVAVVERLGTELGLEVAATFARLDTRAVRLEYSHARDSGATLAMWIERDGDDVPPLLAARRSRVALPLRPQPSVDAMQAEYDRWQTELARVTSDGSNAASVEATMWRARRAQMALARAVTFGGRETIDVTIEVLRVGDAAFVGCNGEPFCEIGLAVKDVSPFAVTFFGGYTGPSRGYIPWPRAFDEGGYEVDTTPYTREAAQALVEAAHEALAGVHRIDG
jgi:hypothetical protein